MFYIILCSGLVIGFTAAGIWKVAKEIHKGNISSSGWLDNIQVDEKYFDIIIKGKDND